VTSPAFCHPAAFRALSDELPNLAGTRGLVRAACAVAAHDNPTAAAGETLRAMDDIVQSVRRRLKSTSPQAVLAHLHDVMFDELGFRGNAEDYYAPANSYLPQVVATRRGLPITLALVYKYIGLELGLTIHGVNAPGHFLVAVETSEGLQQGLMLVDPFHGGTLLSPAEALRRSEMAIGHPLPPERREFSTASHRTWLCRILLNLQAVFAKTGRDRDVYAMQEMQALVERREGAA
jgi:regulator of sirC expression with transglutaminase-like and TPR domain